jgi:hypothetical protein
MNSDQVQNANHMYLGVHIVSLAPDQSAVFPESTVPHPEGRIRGFVRDPAVSQPYHEFPAQGGPRRSRGDRKAPALEFRRLPAESAGHPRTRIRHGSGP